MEIKYIAKYKSKNICYNILNGGGGRRGGKMPDHAKMLIGQKNKIHMTGRKASEETKRKMSETRTNKYVKRKTDVLDIETARKIKELLIKGQKPSYIAKILDIDYKLVNGILSNNTWRHVYVEGWDEWQSSRKRSYRLSEKEQRKIYDMYLEEGKSIKYLSDLYDKHVNTIHKIIQKFNEKSA